MAPTVDECRVGQQTADDSEKKEIGEGLVGDPFRGRVKTP
jgi:hypothetical protein